MGFRDNDINPLLEPAKALIQETPYWQHQNLGLAVFITQDSFQTFRLPLEFDEQVAVSQRFVISPLLPFVTELDTTYYVLAVGLEKTKLFQATPFNIEDVTPESLPQSIEEMLQYEDPERQLQFHTGTAEGKGIRSAMFHGHGVGMDDAQKKGEVLRYFQMVNREVSNVLASKSEPLVLAGQEDLVSLYRQANSYLHLADKAITKDAETLHDEDIHKLSLPMVQDYLEAPKKRAITRFKEGNKSSDDLADILHATTRNQVDTLFVAQGAKKWGEFDPDKDEIVYHEDKESQDVNLFDVAAEKAFMHQARVYILPAEDMPTDHKIAAVYRFSTTS